MIPVFLRKIFLLLLCLMLAGCNSKLNVSDNPPAIPLNPPPETVRVALVLGGGGARGLSHVGVIDVFEQAGIPIDVIVGCSIGSIVGALYADCPHCSNLKHVLRPLKKWDLMDLGIAHARYGLVRGGAIERFLVKNLSCTNFEDLKIPLYVVATDLLAGELVVFNSGSIPPAVHASASVPFIFRPVILYDRLLVDGGVIDPIPVSTAKKTGAQVVIAVDLSTLMSKTCPTNLFGIATRSAEIKLLRQSESCAVGADVILRPELGDLGMFDDGCYELAYKAGRKAALDALPQIQELLSQKGIVCKD